MENQQREGEVKISDDEEYMCRYLVVGELYYKKLRLIRDCRHKEDDSFKKTIIDLNGEIKKAEDLFLKNIAELTAGGMKFSFEGLTKKIDLESHEKRTLLFFVYLQFYQSVSSFCFEMEALSTLDLEDSLFARMRDFKYLLCSGSLIKNRLLFVTVERPGPESSSRGLCLSRHACEIFSKIFSKELPVESECLKAVEGKIEEKEEEKIKGDWMDLGEAEEKLEKSVEDVGFFLEPRYRFEDVVLSDALRDKVLFFLKTFADPGLEQFGACDILKHGKGLVFLFYGPPGTGKSMLAEGIASYLGKKLLMAEMPKLTRKWYGETDKAIADLFRLAKEQNLVLCMNEADSFLYDRTFGVQEHDIRFVNVMLQEIERFEGVAVFTTNMDALLDPALERRVSLRVPFALPDEKIRAEIWRKHIPQKMRLAEDVNFEVLAHTFDFSGGYIKNSVMNATRRIVLEKRDVMTKEDLLFGAQMEKDGLYNKELKKGPVGFAF